MKLFGKTSNMFSILFLCLLSVTAEEFVVPASKGAYGIGASTAKMTDKQRKDPYKPSQHRSVMLSAFYPVGLLAACSTEVVEYMSPATALVQDEDYAQYGLPNGTFESLRLSLCKIPPQTNRYPLLLFSPGLGNSRLIYSALAQSIASHGYIVVTIDHPYDANVVEYPDGTLVFAANITTDAQIEQALTIRVKDISFILDALSHLPTLKQLIPTSSISLNTSHAVVAGHSLGGATAAQAVLEDKRLLGGVNLDGTFFGSVIQKGLRKPFLIFGHEGKNQSTDASWKALWPGLRGWRRELELEGSQHATFSDLPVMVDTLGFRNGIEGVDEVLGSIGGQRAQAVVSTYVAAFGDFLRGKPGQALFNGNVKAYPEVSMVAK